MWLYLATTLVILNLTTAGNRDEGKSHESQEKDNNCSKNQYAELKGKLDDAKQAAIRLPLESLMELLSSADEPSEDIASLIAAALNRLTVGVLLLDKIISEQLPVTEGLGDCTKRYLLAVIDKGKQVIAEKNIQNAGVFVVVSKLNSIKDQLDEMTGDDNQQQMVNINKVVTYLNRMAKAFRARH